MAKAVMRMPAATEVARRRQWRYLCVGLLGTLTLAGSASGMPDTIALSGSASGIRIAVIGDSLSTGAQTPGDPWTDQAASVLGASGHRVEIINAAESGAGYLVPGDGGDTFLGQIDQVVNSRTQVVVIFGSDNDAGLPGLAAAAAGTLRRAESLARRAVVLVIGPPAPPAQSVTALQPIRDTLRSAARAAGAQFVDPLALGWFQGAAQKYVSSDEEHPDADGEVYLAEQMSAVLVPVLDDIAAAAS